MIWIDLEHAKPTDSIPGSAWTPWTTTEWQAWLAKSQQLVTQLAELEQSGNQRERNTLIDDNCAHWGKLKDWLIALSDGRCWFTGARDVCSHYDVEHFRPKKEAKDQWHGVGR